MTETPKKTRFCQVENSQRSIDQDYKIQIFNEKMYFEDKKQNT